MTVRAVTLLELSFLGSPEVRLNGRTVALPLRKALALLAFLACEPGLHAREKLASLLWPEHDESAGRTALRKALGFLNEALESDAASPFLTASRDALGLAVNPSISHDTFDLERAAKRARTSEVEGLTGLRAQLEQVCNRVRGGFLAGFSLPEAFEFEEWLEVRRESVRRDLDTVLQKRSRRMRATFQRRSPRPASVCNWIR